MARMLRVSVFIIAVLLYMLTHLLLFPWLQAKLDWHLSGTSCLDTAFFLENPQGPLILNREQATYRCAIITGASSNHIKPLSAMLTKFWSEYSGYADHFPVIIYDFGMSPEEVLQLQRMHPWVHEIRRFGYNHHDSFVNITLNAGEYAWKPIAVQEATRMFPKVLWVDSGTRLNGKSLFVVMKHLETDGVFSTYSDGTIEKWVHPGTIKYLKYDGSTTKRMVNGAIVGFDSRKSKPKRILNLWVKCARKRDCIAPPGSSRANHRQDQSVLTVLLWKNQLGKYIAKQDEYFGSYHGPYLSYHKEHYDLDFNYCGGKFEKHPVTNGTAFNTIDDLAFCSDSQLGAKPLYIFDLIVDVDRSPLVVLDLQNNHPWEMSKRPDFTVTVGINTIEDAKMFEDTLSSLLGTMGNQWELVLVITNLGKDRQLSLKNLFQKSMLKSNPKFLRARVVVQKSNAGQFSSTDNVAMRISSPKLAYISVSSGTTWSSSGWDVDMARPLEIKSVLAVSARCAQSFDMNVLEDQIGQCGNSQLSSYDKDVFYVRNTVVHGPLLFRASYLQDLDFFDEIHYTMQQHCVHDLMKRAAKLGYIGGFYPINVKSKNALSVAIELADAPSPVVNSISLSP